MGKDQDDAVAGEVNRNRRLSSVLRKAGVVTVLIVIGVGGFAMTAALAEPGSDTSVTPAQDQYEENCNSGRGNSSETDTTQLVDPHSGGTGPGIVGTVDCDPGNSEDVNSGGD